MKPMSPGSSLASLPPEAIQDLRQRGFQGGIILNHRALLTSPGGMPKVLISIGLALVLFFGWLFCIDWVSALWASILSFCCHRLDILSYVTLIQYRLGDVYSFTAPFLHFKSPPPDFIELLAGWITTVLVFAGTFLIPSRHLPVVYLLRVVVFFQLSAQLFFTFMPLAFPYGASGYIHGVLIAGLAVVALVPIVLGFTYFIFDFSLSRKAGLGLIIMLYLMLFIPMQYAAQAFILHNTSLLFLPILFFVFGLPLDVVIFIAFYSWGASWKTHLYEKPPERGNGFAETESEQPWTA